MAANPPPRQEVKKESFPLHRWKDSPKIDTVHGILTDFNDDKHEKVLLFGSFISQAKREREDRLMHRDDLAAYHWFVENNSNAPYNIKNMMKSKKATPIDIFDLAYVGYRTFIQKHNQAGLRLAEDPTPEVSSTNYYLNVSDFFILSVLFDAKEYIHYHSTLDFQFALEQLAEIFLDGSFKNRVKRARYIYTCRSLIQKVKPWEIAIVDEYKLILAVYQDLREHYQKVLIDAKNKLLVLPELPLRPPVDPEGSVSFLHEYMLIYRRELKAFSKKVMASTSFYEDLARSFDFETDSVSTDEQPDILSLGQKFEGLRGYASLVLMMEEYQGGAQEEEDSLSKQDRNLYLKYVKAHMKTLNQVKRIFFPSKKLLRVAVRAFGMIPKIKEDEQILYTHWSSFYDDLIEDQIYAESSTKYI